MGEEEDEGGSLEEVGVVCVEEGFPLGVDPVR